MLKVLISGGGIAGLTWSPDGKRIASGGEDRTIQVWSTSDAVLRDGNPSAILQWRV
jgi:WD40 repeat protein